MIEPKKIAKRYFEKLLKSGLDDKDFMFALAGFYGGVRNEIHKLNTI